MQENNQNPESAIPIKHFPVRILRNNSKTKNLQSVFTRTNKTIPEKNWRKIYYFGQTSLKYHTFQNITYFLHFTTNTMWKAFYVMQKTDTKKGENSGVHELDKQGETSKPE